MLRCRLLAHRYRFWAEGNTMRWDCRRSCGAGGFKRYQTAEDAQRYAAWLDRDDREQLGRRAPVGLTPLRLLNRALRRYG